MPTAPPIARMPGTTNGRALADRDRGSAASRGYDRKWTRFRAWFLARHPLCADCEARGDLTAATEVHHVRKVADYPELRLDPANVRSLCKPCHSVRTARGE